MNQHPRMQWCWLSIHISKKKKVFWLKSSLSPRWLDWPAKKKNQGDGRIGENEAHVSQTRTLRHNRSDIHQRNLASLSFRYLHHRWLLLLALQRYKIHTIPNLFLMFSSYDWYFFFFFSRNWSDGGGGGGAGGAVGPAGIGVSPPRRAVLRVSAA